MVNANKIDGLLRSLENSLNQLRSLIETERSEFLKDATKIGATRYYLQISIESCISIGNHLISAENFRAPQDYRDVFTVLNENKILPDEFTLTMRRMAGLRNLLVHVYSDVDDGQVYDDIRNNLGDFDAFVRYILEFMKKSGDVSA
jgi:uncharacterized protein YutE (UPF0331/DUF86 family)